MVVLHGDKRSEVVQNSIICLWRQRDMISPRVTLAHSAWRRLWEVGEYPFVAGG